MSKDAISTTNTPLKKLIIVNLKSLKHSVEDNRNKEDISKRFNTLLEMCEQLK